MVMDAAARIEGLVDRCARYAEEIAVLQEKQKWVDAGARQPEYGVSVLAVASGQDRKSKSGWTSARSSRSGADTTYAGMCLGAEGKASSERLTTMPSVRGRTFSTRGYKE